MIVGLNRRHNRDAGLNDIQGPTSGVCDNSLHLSPSLIDSPWLQASEMADGGNSWRDMFKSYTLSTWPDNDFISRRNCVRHLIFTNAWTMGSEGS